MKNSSKLDDLLIELVDEWVEFVLNGKAGDGAVAVDKTKQEIKQLFLEIIGEDELNVQDGDATKYSREQLERLIPIRQRLNYFRTELRKKVEDL